MGGFLRMLMRNRFAAALGIVLHGVPRPPRRNAFCDFDEKRFIAYSGATAPDSREAMLGRIAACYHVLEKGICMPGRRLGFGRGIVRQLLPLLERFEARFGTEDGQEAHAVAVLRAYLALHDPNFIREDRTEAAYWNELRRFLEARPGPVAEQRHVRREAFFADRDAPFPVFARARHTVRNYVPGAPVPMERIRAAVDVAREAPSSCNRQPCRVRCVSDSAAMSRILELQGGSRGFGHLAGTLLLVTVDLADASHERERADPFVCGGMFLMALSYALFHEEVAHCILNWSRSPSEDCELRKVVRLSPSENVVAVLACGLAPDEFDVCASPRKPLSEIFVEDARGAPGPEECRRK